MLSRWSIVAIGFVALAVSFSARAVVSLAMPVWEAELGWDRGFVAGAAAIGLLVMAGLAPVAGNLVDRRGPRGLLVVGLGAIGLGLLAIAGSDNRWLFAVAFGGLAAIGFALVATHVMATAIAARFDTDRGLAIGIGTAGATAGQFVLVPLLAVLLAVAGWQASFGALGVLALALAPAAFFALGRAAPVVRPTPAEPLGERLRFLARSPAFHVLFWSFLICGFTTTGAIEVHFLPYAALCGFPPLPSATAYGVLSAVNLAGMIAAGWLVDRVNRPALLAAIYVGRGLAFILLLQVGDDLGLLMVFAVLFGALDYSTVPVTASLVASHLGLRVMGLAMGLISAGHALGAAAGTALGGWLWDSFGRYDGLWLVSTALALAAGLLVLSLRERHINHIAVT